MIFNRLFNKKTLFYKILDLDQEQKYSDNSIFAKAAKIERLTDELLHVHDLQGITPERKEYIHLILGYEPGLSLTFDPTLVQHPNTFMDNVEKQFAREVKKGAAQPIPKPTYRKKSKNAGKAKETKIANYSWIPMSEIHTARTRIDSFVHLTAEERKELHLKFASLVSNLISQFDSIGKVDDNHITADQAASLTASFSKALVEIQNSLFQPIVRAYKLKKRGPLFNPKKAFDGRQIHYRTKQTLSDVSNNILRNNNDSDDDSEGSNEADNLQNGTPEIRVFSKNRETYDKSVLPPQYRPKKKFKAPEVNRESFLEMAQKIRKEMEDLEREREERAKIKPIKVPERKKVEILATPRKPPQPTPRIRTRREPRKKNSITSNHSFSSLSTPRKIPYSNPTTPISSRSIFSERGSPNLSNFSNISTDSPTASKRSKIMEAENPFSSLFDITAANKSKSTLTYDQIKHPENDFFDSIDVSLCVTDAAGVETGQFMEGIDRLFSPLRPKKKVEVQQELKVAKLMPPDKEVPKEEAQDGHYLFKPNLESVTDLLNSGEVLEIDKKHASDEHENLVELWDKLSLHPDTRLLMAAKLCTLCTDDYNSEYQFKTIMSATEVLQRYQSSYKRFKNVLKYEPCSPENSESLDQLATEFMVNEAAFIQANKNMTQILGTEINTIRGTVEELIQIRSKKIRNLKINAGFDISQKDDDQNNQQS